MDGIQYLYPFVCSSITSIDKLSTLESFLESTFFLTDQSFIPVYYFKYFNFLSFPIQAEFFNVCETSLQTRPSVFVFDTGRSPKILDSIYGTACNITFGQATCQQLLEYVEKITSQWTTKPTERVLHQLVKKARGSYGKAASLVDLLEVVGPDVFERNTKDCELALLKMMTAMKSDDSEQFEQALREVSGFVLTEVKHEFYILIERLVERITTGTVDTAHEGEFTALSEIFHQKYINLFKFIMSDWAVNAFENSHTAHAFFRLLFKKFQVSDPTMASPVQVVKGKKHNDFRKR